MRVLHLDSGPTLQGGQIQVIRLVEGLERLRVNQVVLARGELQRKVGAGLTTRRVIPGLFCSDEDVRWWFPVAWPFR